MELTTDYWILLLANGLSISLPGMLLYFGGLTLLTLTSLARKKYWVALGLAVAYTWVWVALGIWWTTN